MTGFVPEWRSPEQRFALYAIRDDELIQFATADSREAIGVAFGVLLEEQEFRETDIIGVLDSHGNPDAPGEWLVNPFNTRRKIAI